MKEKKTVTRSRIIFEFRTPAGGGFVTVVRIFHREKNYFTGDRKYQQSSNLKTKRYPEFNNQGH